MSNKNTLNFLHEESVRLNSERLEMIKRFYITLSDYEDLRDFLKSNNELSTDERRAKFLCVLARNKFISNQKDSDFFEVPIEKCDFKEKSFTNKKINIKLSFGEHDKVVSVSVHISDNWDEVKIEYRFDSFSLASGIFIDEKTTGESTITISQDPHPIPYEDKYRDDDDIRFVIDELHRQLKMK